MQIVNILKSAGIENYIFEAKQIESHGEKYSLNETEIFELAKRRINREPLQYILGEWDFYGDLYKLNSSCLIPRPETEFLTQFIIENFNVVGTNVVRPNIILDLCSGSGCVSISAVKRCENLRAILIDISKDAIEISKGNAKLNGVFDRIEFFALDIIKDFETIKSLDLKVDLIVANPPYLTKFETQEREFELKFEPERAFFGGDDGLDFYRFIIANYKNICNRFAFECGINQASKIKEIFKLNGFDCDIIRDYNKIERVVYNV